MEDQIHNPEWCLTPIMLDKIRSDGFDVYGLKYLKKMLKCIAKAEYRSGIIVNDCLKDVEKVWTRCRDDPFLDDFGEEAMHEIHSESEYRIEHSRCAEKDNPIHFIKRIVKDAECKLRYLMDSNYDMPLIPMIKRRSRILKDIEQHKEAYHNCWRKILAYKDLDGQTETTKQQEITNLLNTDLERKRCDYEALLKLEEDQREQFFKVCRAAKTLLMRHELALFLKKKEAFTMAADWLEKTSLVKSQGGPENAMVVFLRKKSQEMNAKQFVDGWLKLNCEPIIVPRFEEYTQIQGDFNKSSWENRTEQTKIINLTTRTKSEGKSALVKSASSPDVQISTTNAQVEHSGAQRISETECPDTETKKQDKKAEVSTIGRHGQLKRYSRKGLKKWLTLK